MFKRVGPWGGDIYVLFRWGRKREVKGLLRMTSRGCRILEHMVSIIVISVLGSAHPNISNYFYHIIRGIGLGMLIYLLFIS